MLLNLDECVDTLRAGECVSERSLKYLCQYVAELLMEESNVQPVTSPVTVCMMFVRITAKEWRDVEQRRWHDDEVMIAVYNSVAIHGFGVWFHFILNVLFNISLDVHTRFIRLWGICMANILICSIC